jgi:hypothetical protein
VNDDLVRRMVAASELHGDFVLSSGRRSSVYFDKFRFLTDPALLREVAKATASLIPADVTMLGAPEGAAMLESIGETLKHGGHLYLPTGTIQDERTILAKAREMFGERMQAVIEKDFPLPDVVGKSLAAARMMKDGLLNLHKRGSRWLWRLRVWRCER